MWLPILLLGIAGGWILAQVTVTIIRDGQPMELEVELGEPSGE